MGDRLDAILEGESRVGGAHAEGRAEVDLELRGTVLAVGGDQVDAGSGHLVENSIHDRHVGIADTVEDVDAAKRGLAGGSIQYVQLVLESGAEREATLLDSPQQALQDL